MKMKIMHKTMAILKMLSEAMRRHVTLSLFKPVHHTEWNDCYSYDPETGWHMLLYQLHKTEETCHSIAIHDGGTFLVDDE